MGHVRGKIDRRGSLIRYASGKGRLDLGLIRMRMLFQKASLQAHTPVESAAVKPASLCVHAGQRFHHLG
jgi:hypothetical protein